ncbi:hypothetical protein AA313_de0202212 [Arthrobotrys entomopaga]|nr:hypothetical protein AA313_de0202212 [Arthrobotrys entomopaga]
MNKVLYGTKSDGSIVAPNTRPNRYITKQLDLQMRDAEEKLKPQYSDTPVTTSDKKDFSFNYGGVATSPTGAEKLHKPRKPT